MSNIISERASYRTSPGGACPGCSTTLYLSGGHWHDHYKLARFIILCIALAILLPCLLIRCAKHRRSNVAGKGMYLGALLSTILLFILLIISEAVSETGVRLTYSYYAIFPITIGISYIAIIFILATIAQIARVQRIALVSLLFVLTILAILATALAIVSAVYEVNSYYITSSSISYGKIELAQASIDLVFDVVALFSVGAFVGLFMRLREYSQMAKVATIIASMSLAIAFILTIASDALYIQSTTSTRYYLYSSTAAYNFLRVVGEVNDALLTVTLVLLFLVFLRDSDPSKTQQHAYGTYASAPAVQYSHAPSADQYAHAAPAESGHYTHADVTGPK